jgi:hypothetical protein
MSRLDYVVNPPARDQEYWDRYAPETIQHRSDTQLKTSLQSGLPILPCASMLLPDLCPSALPASAPYTSHLQIPQDEALSINRNTTYGHHLQLTYYSQHNAIAYSPPLQFPTPLPESSCVQPFPLREEMILNSTYPPFQTSEGIVPAHSVNLEIQDLYADCDVTDAFEGMGFGLAGWIAMERDSTMDVGRAGIWGRERSVVKTSQSDINCYTKGETAFKQWPVPCPPSASSFSETLRPMPAAEDRLYLVHEPHINTDGGRSLTTRKRKRETLSSDQSMNNTFNIGLEQAHFINPEQAEIVAAHF